MLLGTTTEHCQKTVFRFITYEHKFICIYTCIYATETKAHKKYANQFKEPFLNILHKICVNVNIGETCAAEVTVGTSILTS